MRDERVTVLPVRVGLVPKTSAPLPVLSVTIVSSSLEVSIFAVVR